MPPGCLYLDDVSHSCMLHDISKLHTKAGMCRPDFPMLDIVLSVTDTGPIAVVVPSSQVLVVIPANASATSSSLAVPVANNTLALQGSEPNSSYFCYECGNISQTTKGWYNHRRLTHGIFPASKYLVDGHVCKVCLKLFPSISRMYQHLEQDSKRCLAAWESLDLRLNREQLESVECVRKSEAKYLVSMGYRETKSLYPIVRVHGPLRNFALEDFEILQHAIPVLAHHEELSSDTQAELPVPAMPVRESLLPGGALPTQHPIDPATLSSATYFPLLQMVGLNIKLVLHLFPGQRREHDLQAEFEHELLQFGSFMCNVFVLSEDIVLHPQLGDLTNPQAIALWQDLIMLGVVIFVMAGPPCETWSAARFLRLEEDGAYGPRPLCSQQQLWGLTCLRKAEANSISVGNALLRATIRRFCPVQPHTCSDHGAP